MKEEYIHISEKRDCNSPHFDIDLVEYEACMEDRELWESLGYNHEKNSYRGCVERAISCLIWLTTDSPISPHIVVLIDKDRGIIFVPFKFSGTAIRFYNVCCKHIEGKMTFRK